MSAGSTKKLTDLATLAERGATDAERTSAAVALEIETRKMRKIRISNPNDSDEANVWLLRLLVLLCKRWRAWPVTETLPGAKLAFFVVDDDEGRGKNVARQHDELRVVLALGQPIGKSFRDGFFDALERYVEKKPTAAVESFERGRYAALTLICR